MPAGFIARAVTGPRHRIGVALLGGPPSPRGDVRAQPNQRHGARPTDAAADGCRERTLPPAQLATLAALRRQNAPRTLHAPTAAAAFTAPAPALRCPAQASRLLRQLIAACCPLPQGCTPAGFMARVVTGPAGRAALPEGGRTRPADPAPAAARPTDAPADGCRDRTLPPAQLAILAALRRQTAPHTLHALNAAAASTTPPPPPALRCPAQASWLPAACCFPPQGCTPAGFIARAVTGPRHRIGVALLGGTSAPRGDHAPSRTSATALSR
jgi:hypothetical protein